MGGFSVLGGGTYTAESITPPGSVATFGPGDAYAQDGATFPALGVFGGAFLGFDDAATETAMWSIGGRIPDHWRSVSYWLETFQFGGDPGANDACVWQINVNSAGDDVTTQTVTAATQQTIFRVGDASYDLNSNSVDGVDKYGAVVQLSRLGGSSDPADNFSGDMLLSSLHVMRVT